VARTRGTGDTVAFEDITSERGLAGENPLFRTDRDAPTDEAVREVEARARDNPATLKDALGERVVFRSETDRLPGDLEAQPGESELPGLFTSPDASPINATVTSGGSSGLRLPFRGGATRPETFSAFETDDVRGIPDRAAGSGRVRGPDPGLDTPGGRFLAEEAERGPAFVRPSGDRTPELEGIIPPGTAFERVGTRRLSGVGGGTIDLFRRAPDSDTSDLDLDQPPRQRGDGDRELFTGSEIRSRERRSRDDETMVPPPAGTSAGLNTGGSTGPISSDPSPTGAGTPESGAVGSSSPGVNPRGSPSRPSSQTGGTSTTSTTPDPDPTTTSTTPDPDPSITPPPTPDPDPTITPPPTPDASARADLRRRRLREDNDDDPEEELLFASGAVDERFINPIERLGDPDAGPDIGSPPEFDGAEYGGP